MYPDAAQIRMARAGLGLSQDELAGLARVSDKTIANIELGKRANRSTLELVMMALMAKGVRFTYDPETKRRGVEGPPAPEAP